ncbi:hypothetical protein HYFRA_00011937 [Hymenoscyphus fraxineus]|uniref:Uncharacterized protein n=1 Tax=Hymenoscyphus fraxineus TaxID=746836 RepID=A0A9N9L0X9_9HELO|nr:hypothetical protein HYFRA_00011937 [Hymenoscyphus fraxineus]
MMGRTSKFSFPIPGRKKHSRSESQNTVSLEPQHISPPSLSNLSKANKILGTDSPTIGEDASWKFPSSTSSRINISISESPNDNDNWENGSDALGKRGSLRKLRAKASSTLLGQNYGDDNGTGWRLRHESSNSTLRSHYDRQNTPLSVSQQTSASSVRDLALRKGFPPIAQRSPLLQSEAPYQDPYETRYKANEDQATPENDREQHQEKELRKKPAKLDLTLLFPRPSRRNTGKSTDSSLMTSSSMSTDGSHTPSSETSKRKLRKSRSKEFAQNLSIRSSHSQDPQNGRMEHLENLQDSFEQSIRSPMTIPRLDQIPESGVPQETTIDPDDESMSPQYHQFPIPPSDDRKNTNPEGNAPFSWKNVRASTTSSRESSDNIPQRRDTIDYVQKKGVSSSSASVLSKGSRRTNGSGTALSNSDLKFKSVLSLSSDSEDEAWEPKQTRTPQRNSENASWGEENISNTSRLREERTRQSLPARGSAPYGHRQKDSDLGGSANLNNHIALSEKIPTSTSSAQRSSRREDFNIFPSQQNSYHQASPREHDKKGHRAHPSISSARSGRSGRSGPQSVKSRLSGASLSPLPPRAPSQPTPPLSPASMNFREASSEKNSRLMAVTQQEEALLSALREKRTQIREKIIKEHEHQVSLSPTGTRPSHLEEQKRVLLYLEPPLADDSEPSPDLSDFLAFESDMETTPRRASHGKGGGRPRPDSYIVDPSTRREPMTQSTARISAVGAPGGLQRNDSKRKNGGGVRFANDTKNVQPTPNTADAQFFFN